jgi:hypothetical protein
MNKNWMSNDMKLATRVLVGVWAVGLAWVCLPNKTYGDGVSTSPAARSMLARDDDDNLAVDAVPAPDEENAQSDVADSFRSTTCYASGLGGYVACL